jgi:arginine deiminase
MERAMTNVGHNSGGVSERDLEKALDWLRDNADEAARAKAERIYCEEYRKSLKAVLMKQHAQLPLGAQEREAYADERYLMHLDKLRTAVFEDERIRALRVAAELKIEAWRTQQANFRAMKI